MVFDLGSDRSHQVHEVLLDDSDDVEAIGDDLGVGEVPADQGPVGGAQIHADDADVFLAFESGEVGVKVLRVTAFDDVEDPVGSQVAEGGGELGCPSLAGALAMDGVLVDAEDGRADAVGTFSGFKFGVFVIDAFDGGRTEFFVAGDDAACNAIAVLLVDEATEGFGGVPVGFDAWERRNEGLPALSALIAVGVDLEVDVPAEAVEMTNGADIRPLAVDLQSPGLATLVRGSLPSTARAGRTCCVLSFEVQDRMVAMLLDGLDLIPCDSDFFQLH